MIFETCFMRLPMKQLANLFVVACLSAGMHTLAWAQPADFSDMVERADNAVVNVRTFEKASQPEMDALPWLGEFCRSLPPQLQAELCNQLNDPRGQRPQPKHRKAPEQKEVPAGTGSGFLISEDGYVMTNHNVVDGASNIIVTLADKREFKAKLIGSDERTDVALLKIEGKGFPKLPIGDPDKLRKGEWVVAIGSPFGLNNTVTAGVVSAKARDTGEYLPLIQSDVAVNPGNSGGPLLNTRGEVVGINSQILSRTGGSIGISFAIPINEAMRVSEELRLHGKITRAWLGVRAGPITSEMAESMKLDKTGGAFVAQVIEGSPAERAGLQSGDVIVQFDGKTIESSADLPRLVGAAKPGSTVSLRLWRNGASKTVMVTLTKMPSESVTAGDEEPPAPKTNALGLAVKDLSNEQRQASGVREGGVVIVAVEGRASRTEIAAGDLLLSINNVRVNNAQHFNQLIEKLDKQRSVGLLVQRGRLARYLVLPAAK
ncbi:MAG: DegQ family serine endoprotease [Burkholderiaceae bacterium]|nr:MAG: DegQ family serine endoprotease [Burkholderiaceae bacterium]